MVAQIRWLSKRYFAMRLVHKSDNRARDFMDGWAQVLYSKFFLRDVLGKVIPGAIAVLVLWHIF